MPRRGGCNSRPHHPGLKPASTPLHRCFLNSLLPIFSVEQIRLLAGDAVPERLKLEPANQGQAYLRVRELGGFVGNLARLAGRFGEQLRLAGAVHGDEPPGGFVDGLPNRQKAMIAEDGGFFVAQRFGDAVAFIRAIDDAGVIVKHDVIFVERAGILRERIEQPSERGPRFAIERMGMRGGDDIGARFVNSE